MVMTRDELATMKEWSNASKAGRRAAISAAGPFLDAVRRAQLQQTLLEDCRLSPTQADAVIKKISTGADDDDADPREVIQNALTDENLLGKSRVNRSFAGKVSGKMAAVVEAGLKERDDRIVAAGGPKRPGPGWTMNF